MTKPLDKILCGGKFYRYVVACMHNCPRPHLCIEFWKFFEAIERTPAEYYNEDGIGDKVMRRIVFDCDRCGKRDLLEVYGLYNLEGEVMDDRLDDIERADMVLQAGHTGEHVSRITFLILEQLEEAHEWRHYCRACFKDIADGVARMIKPPAQRVRKRKKLAKARIAGKVEPKVAAPVPLPEPPPEEPAVEEPAPAPVAVEPAPAPKAAKPAPAIQPDVPADEPEAPAKKPARRKSAKAAAKSGKTEPVPEPKAEPEPAAEPVRKPARRGRKKTVSGAALKL